MESKSEPPFTMGKKTALSITPDKDRFNLLLTAAPAASAAHRETMKSRCRHAPLAWRSWRGLFFFAYVQSERTREKQEEKRNARMRNSFASSLKGEL